SDGRAGLTMAAGFHGVLLLGFPIAIGADCVAGEKRGSCLTVLRDAATDGRLFGKPGKDNFCSFASVCFGMACPIKPGAPEFPLLPWPSEELLFGVESPSSSCSKLLNPSCAAEYQRAELDCARDPHSRSIWEGETQGLCPRCQKLVRAYQQLSKLCQTGRDFSLDALKLHFLERSASDDVWRSDLTAAAAARFVAERRDMGHRFQREFQELLKEAHKSCKALQGEKRRRRRQLRQRQANMPASKEDGCEDDGQEAAEEENITVDDVVEVEETSRDKLIRNFFSMSTFPKETLPQVPEQEKNELLAPLQAPPPGVPRHSAESLNLRHKARKLGLAQRYVEAFRGQGLEKLYIGLSIP
ncbi:unnamed protein product, partial [Symbiodinium microadriaticum]